MTLNLPPAWRSALPGFVIVLIAVLLLFGQTGMAMVDIWQRSDTFAHGFVVPPISIWLIWRQRARLALLAPRASVWVLLPMAAMAALWLAAELAAVNSASQLAFTALLILCVPLMLGWQVTRLLVFPLCFLLFCVPFGEFMLPQLMEWTADFTVFALRMSGVPVYREGLHFIIPSGSWSVVQACSGIRYLIASVMVGTLFAYLNYRSVKRRLIFVLIAFALPLLANWLRAYMIVMLGHLSGNRIATGVDHIIYGWVFFGIVMMLLFTVGMRWSEPELPQAQAQGFLVSSKTGNAALAGGLALLILLIPTWALRRLESTAPHRLAMPSLAAPALEEGGWMPAALPEHDFRPHFELPRAEMQAGFSKAGAGPVGLYLAYYRDQDRFSKLISSNNALALPEDPHWLEVQTGVTQAKSLTWRTASLRATDLARVGPSQQLLAWQIYWVEGHWTASDAMAKLYAARSRLLGQGDDSAAIVLYVSPTDGGEALLRRFAEENFAPIDAWLNRLRSSGAVAAQRK